MDGSTTLRDSALHMQSFANSELAIARRRKSFAHNAVKRVEKSLVAEKARLAEMTALVARLESEKRKEAS